MQAGDTVLLLIDLGRGKNRLGGTAQAQTKNQISEQAQHIEKLQDLKDFLKLNQRQNTHNMRVFIKVNFLFLIYKRIVKNRMKVCCVLQKQAC